MPNYLYTAENEYMPELIHEFGIWYAHRHVPDVFRVGFQSAASYRAVEGGLNLFGIYEIPSPAVFDDPLYKSIGQRDPHRAAYVEGRISKRAYTLYEQMNLHPVAEGRDPPRLDADWLSVLRFEAPGIPDGELIAFFQGGAGAAMASRGCRNLRFGRRKGERPNSVTDRPACILIAEFPCRPGPAVDMWRDFTDRYGSLLMQTLYYQGYREYPWRDDPTDIG